MKPSRRGLLQFAGGAAVGALFTPAPWRLITDTAIWSENWPGIPRPPRGPIRAKFTNCSLCTAGCAMRVRCVGDQPVALAGVAGHPLSAGAICPFGVAAHHLPYHPARVRQGPVEAAKAAVTAAMAQGARLAVLDLRPGRTASWTYRRAVAAIPGAMYLANAQTAAVDLSTVRTVLSFGAPLFDGWGTPGNVIAARENFRLVVAEPVESRAAVMADVWVPIRPGSEGEIARGVAEALSGGPVASPEVAAIVRELVEHGPAVVLDADRSEAVMELNRKLGAVGRTIVARREAPVPDEWKQAAPVTSIAEAPDHSIGALLIDESAADEYVAWSTIEKKLAHHAVVVTFAISGEGYGRHAGFVLPAPVFSEAVEDIPPSIDCCRPVFRLSASLVAPPEGVVNPAEFVAKLCGMDAANALRERADAIHESKTGSMFTYAEARTVEVKNIGADDFWKALNEGACWLGTATPGRGMASELTTGAAVNIENVVLCERTRPALVSPLFSKLYRESNLQLGANRVALNPATLRESGVRQGGRALLQTDGGHTAIEVIGDPSVPPGVVQVASTPGLIDLCGANGRAKVVPA